MKIKPLLAILLSTTALASGDLITGLTVESATTGLNPEMGPEKAINGFGLDGDVPSLTSSHREQFSSNWWSGWSGDVTEWQITIDLGANYDLTETHIWNYRENCCAGRGLSSVEIYVSPDENEDNLVKLITDGTGEHDNDDGGFSFPQAPTGGDYLGFDLDVSSVTNAALLDNVRLFRIDGGSSLHGGGQVHGGLAEIQFDGVPASVGPEDLAFEIIPLGDTLTFSWAGKDGRLYDLVSSTNLSTPPGEWSIYEGNSNIVGSILTEVPFDGNTRFFALIEKNAQ